MTPVSNPTGKHRRKRRHHGDGTVVLRKDRWRAKPWAAVVPYLDESGRKREMWLSAASKAEADDLRQRELARLRRGIVPTFETVGQYVTGWLATVEVGPGTWPRYQQHVTERIIPSFGDIALDRLTPQQVRSALIGWSGSPQTRGGTLRLLRAAMKQAVADRRIEHDPTAGIPYPKVRSHEPTTLDGRQARQLMASVKGQRFAPILVVSLGLGLRRGEALGLRTQDVDLRSGSVTIAKSLRYIAPKMRAEGEDAYRLVGTKTGETRVVPLPTFVAEALRERLDERDQEKRAARVWAGNDFVFCSPVGNSVPLETLYRWFKSALVNAKLPDMRWHDLRSSCVTLLYEMNVPEAIIMAIVGHRDLATTRRYRGKTPLAMQHAADRMNEAIG